MFNDEFPEALESLRGVPSNQVKDRAKSEGETVLASGRTPPEVLDLVQELTEVLDDIWKNDRFVRVPQQFKGTIINSVNQLVGMANQYGAGQKPFQEVEKRVDALHNQLWQYNLIDRIDELPGFEQKNEKLEFLKRKGRRIIRELKKGIPKRDEIIAAAEQVAESQQRVEDLKGEVAQASQDASQNLSATKAALNQTQQHLAEAERLETQIENAEKRARQAANETEALKAKINQYHEEVDTYQEKLEGITKKAETAVAQNTAATEKLVSRNKDLAGQIEKQLQKATGASLFSAFHERRKVISVAKWIWGGVSVLSLMFTVGWGVYLAESTTALNALFYTKLGATVPLLALVVFALSQYGRERRAEAEYAFKAALSLSLVPYKELIEGLGAEAGDEKYATFLVETIGQIYQAPRMSSDESGGRNAVPLRGIKEITNLIEKAVNR